MEMASDLPERDCSNGCLALSELTGAVNTIVATTDLRVKRVEDGVSNYVKFMAEAREFFTDHKAREEETKKFRDTRDAEIKDDLMKRDNKIMKAIGLVAILIAIIGALLALPPAIASLKDLLRSDINWHKIIGLRTDDFVTSHLKLPQTANDKSFSVPNQNP